jgi:hypothetical protein
MSDSKSEVQQASIELLSELYNSMREDILPLREDGFAAEADYLESRCRIFRAELATRRLSLDDLYIVAVAH